jgi:diadenosine tetraphosphatase ApaH/serine/threonine PP2A family protein phosphatase
MPSETLTLLQSVSITTHFIRGNAEAELLRYWAGEEPGGLSERANEEARWLAQILMPEHKQFLSRWPATLELELDGQGRVLFCHATPCSDTQVFTRLTSEEKLAPIFGNLTVSLVVCGHTHMQFERRIGGVRVVNAGSVGMPFGKTGSDWLLLDTEIELRHTDYNMTEAAARIRQSNYPQAEDFAANNVLQMPSEDQALAMLSLLEMRQAQQR